MFHVFLCTVLPSSMSVTFLFPWCCPFLVENCHTVPCPWCMQLKHGHLIHVSQNLVSGSTAWNLNILKENIKVLVGSSLGRKMWMMLSVHWAGHARSVGHNCKWNHAAWSKTFPFHVCPSTVSPHTSQLFLLELREWNQNQIVLWNKIFQWTLIQIN